MKWTTFLLPNQQCQSTERTNSTDQKLKIHQSYLRCFTVSDVAHGSHHQTVVTSSMPFAHYSLFHSKVSKKCIEIKYRNTYTYLNLNGKICKQIIIIIIIISA